MKKLVDDFEEEMEIMDLRMDYGIDFGMDDFDDVTAEPKAERKPKPKPKVLPRYSSGKEVVVVRTAGQVSQLCERIRVAVKESR